jgi:beta-lactamase superfamily II metal-dependent hydrolase
MYWMTLLKILPSNPFTGNMKADSGLRLISKKLFANILPVVALACLQTSTFAQSKVGDTFPGWKAGYMDIHHINTGKGECVFAILPDGTTMMIDAGEITGSPYTVEARPNNSKTPGEWISRYIQHMMQPLADKKIDYILASHLHDDHMGSVSASKKKSAKGNYMLTGISEVGENIPFGKIVDRGWPDYNWPRPLANEKNVQNHIQFIKHAVTGGATAEQFKAGSSQQFKLLKKAAQYPEFEIRNIAVNGQVWTGTGENARNHFPPLERLSKDEYPTENQCSAAIRISYGNFDYFNGGDLVHSSAPAGAWQNIETAAGIVTGPVEVCEANHHAAYDAMGENFLMAVRPRVVVIQTWGASHPNYSSYMRMVENSKIYPGDRDIFTTNLMQETTAVISERRLGPIKSRQGHVVVRVRPGGGVYDIYILDDSSESFSIKSIHGPYESR